MAIRGSRCAGDQDNLKCLSDSEVLVSLTECQSDILQALRRIGQRITRTNRLSDNFFESIARITGRICEQIATGRRIPGRTSLPGAQPCRDPANTDPTPPRASPASRTCPSPRSACQSRNYRRRPCPRCGHSAYRDRLARRTLHDLGNPLTGRPCDIVLIYSQHYCSRCRKYFNADMTDLADPGSHYTRRVVDAAVRLVIEDGLPYRTASWTLWREHRVFVPYATIQNWVEAGGEKGGATDRPPTTSTGHCRTSRATSPPTSCMTARSASSRSSTTAPSSGSPTRSSTTTRPTRTSRRSSAASTPPWRRAG